MQSSESRGVEWWLHPDASHLKSELHGPKCPTHARLSSLRGLAETRNLQVSRHSSTVPVPSSSIAPCTVDPHAANQIDDPTSSNAANHFFPPPPFPATRTLCPSLPDTRNHWRSTQGQCTSVSPAPPPPESSPSSPPEYLPSHSPASPLPPRPVLLRRCLTVLPSPIPPTRPHIVLT